MNSESSKTSKYLEFNEFETILKYLYENNIPYDQINYNSEAIIKLIRAEKNLSLTATKHKFKKLLASIPSFRPLSTDMLIPEGRSLYIRKFPRYMPVFPHIHEDALEINIVLQGELYQQLNSDTIVMKNGDICFIAPHTPHSTSVNNDNTVVLSIMVYRDILKDVLDDLNIKETRIYDFFTKILYGSHHYPFLICETKNDFSIQEMIISMENIQDNPSPFIDKFMVSGLKMFLLSLLMFHNDQVRLGTNVESNDTSIYNLMEYIDAHIADVTLESLSKTYNYSVSYLSSLIYSQYGKTFTEIVTGLRLKKAIHLLETTDYNLGKIADFAGFTDKSHLIKRFKKYYGITPGEYKNQHCV